MYTDVYNEDRDFNWVLFEQFIRAAHIRRSYLPTYGNAVCRKRTLAPDNSAKPSHLNKQGCYLQIKRTKKIT